MGDASCLVSPESRMGREERGAGGWGRKILTCALVGAAALPSVQGFATPCGALARGKLGLSAQPAWHLAAPRASGLAGRELSRGLPGRLHRQGARGFQSPVAAFECNGAGGSSKAMSVVEEYGGKLIRIDNVDSWNKLLAAYEEAGAVLVAEFRAAMCRKVTSPPPFTAACQWVAWLTATNRTPGLPHSAMTQSCATSLPGLLQSPGDAFECLASNTRWRPSDELRFVNLQQSAIFRSAWPWRSSTRGYQPSTKANPSFLPRLTLLG
jgi:hypothetical protein